MDEMDQRIRDEFRRRKGSGQSCRGQDIGPVLGVQTRWVNRKIQKMRGRGEWDEPPRERPRYKERVIAARDSLVASGIEPSRRAIAEVLGISINTVQSLMRRMERRGVVPAPRAQRTIPGLSRAAYEVIEAMLVEGKHPVRVAAEFSMQPGYTVTPGQVRAVAMRFEAPAASDPTPQEIAERVGAIREAKIAEYRKVQGDFSATAARDKVAHRVPRFGAGVRDDA